MAEMKLPTPVEIDRLSKAMLILAEVVCSLGEELEVATDKLRQARIQHKEADKVARDWAYWAAQPKTPDWRPVSMPEDLAT